MNVAAVLQIPYELMPGVPIVRAEGETWDYARLERESAAVCDWLTRQGIGPGATVATLQSFSPAFTALAFGTMASGATIAPLNARAKRHELVKLLEPLGARLLVVDERYGELAQEALRELGRGAAPRLLRTAELTAELGAAAASPAALDPREPEDGAVAILLHTSGTTGRPKPVPLTHDGVAATLLRTVLPADGSPRGATLLSVPNHHVAGLVALLSSVFAGRRIELLPAFTSAGWLELAAASGVDHAFVVPTMLQRIVADPALAQADLSHLRILAYGAAPMPRRVIADALARFPRSCGFVGSYGQTETGGTVCVLAPEDHERARDGEPDALARLGSIGRPLDGVELAILPPDGMPPAPGHVGEIAVRLPGDDAGEWRRTGDLGRLDAAGYVYLTSRQDDLIIRGGENIDPAEVEEVLGEHPDVEEVAVAGVPDEEWGQVVGAYVVARPGSTPDADALVAHVKRSLASFKAPARVTFVEALPRTAMGKIRRRELAEPSVRRSS